MQFLLLYNIKMYVNCTFVQKWSDSLVSLYCTSQAPDVQHLYLLFVCLGDD